MKNIAYASSECLARLQFAQSRQSLYHTKKKGLDEGLGQIS